MDTVLDEIPDLNVILNEVFCEIESMKEILNSVLDENVFLNATLGEKQALNYLFICESTPCNVNTRKFKYDRRDRLRPFRILV